MNEDFLFSSIICLGTDWYSPTKSSTSQVVDCFYQQGMKILWINPIPIRFPSTRRSDFWVKVQSKARMHTRFLTKPQKNFYVFSPLYFPLFSVGFMHFNRIIISIQLISLCQLLRISSPLIFFSTFTAWYVLPVLKHTPSVFHFADKLSAFRETYNNPNRRLLLEKMETEMILAAKLVTCSSQSIYQYASNKVSSEAKKIFYLPHGVPASKFRSIVEGNIAIPADLQNIPKPIAGYFGSLTEANDKATFKFAAKNCPDWSFVFIGEVGGDYSELAKLRNVFFLGHKSYEEIPNYGKFFDVCFMGWVPHEWITNCSPIKALEYMALGKPVVCSSFINELEQYKPFVRVTQTPDEFVTALRDAYTKNTKEYVKASLEFVSNYSWESHVLTILQKLKRQK